MFHADNHFNHQVSGGVRVWARAPLNIERELWNLDACSGGDFKGASCDAWDYASAWIIVDYIKHV